MRWLCDENVPRNLVDALRQHGHDIVWIREDFPGMPDTEVLALAIRERRVCLTFDKDFGQLATSTSFPSDSGVVLLRLPAPNSKDRIQSMVAIVESRADWVGYFSVVEPGRIRMRPLSSRGQS
jgi:predicted nuclease of predicted toxin-antitoxin system